MQAALERLRLGLWAGSAVFLAAAAVNLLGIEITPTIAMFAALSATLAVTLTVLARRPRLETCALRADRTFHTQALMVTALELSTKTTQSEMPAAVVVSNRACAAARQLKHQLGSVWRAPRLAGFVIAVVPVFVATVLFAVSDGDPATSGGAGDPLMSLGLVDQSRLDSDAGLRELRQSITSGATPRNERRDADDSNLPASLAPRYTAAAGASESAVITEARNGPAPVLLVLEGGREAGRAQRTAALSGNRELPGNAPGRRESLWLQRQGEAMAGIGDASRSFDESASPSVPAGPIAQAAAAPPTLSAWTTLTPAEVAYARRYLGKETDND